MPAPPRNKDRLQEIGKELAEIRAETQKAVSDIQGEIASLKKTIDKLHKRRWRTNLSVLINVVTIIALIAGLYFQRWLNRPVVDYQLTALAYSYSLIQLTPFNPPAQAFHFEAQNTGQTDMKKTRGYSATITIRKAV
jgi:4-hydroxybenzoate polyprenyltransferase